MKKQVLASVILLLTALIWGLAFVAQILGAGYLGPFSFNCVRFFLGGIFLIPICLLAERKKNDRRTRGRIFFGGAICGTVLFLASSFQQYGTGLCSNPGKAGFITGVYTVLTPVFYFVFFRRKSGVRTWIGAVLAATGLLLLFFDPETGLRAEKGYLFILLSAVFWAWHIIALDRFIQGLPALKFSCVQFLCTGVLNLVAALLTEHTAAADLRAALPAIIFCGILSTGVGFTGQTVGQKLMENPSKSAILLSTESLFSMLGGFLWNLLPIDPALRVETEISPYGIVGCALIFAAIICAQLPERLARTPGVAQQ